MRFFRNLLLYAAISVFVLGALTAQSVTVTREPTDEEFHGPFPSWKNVKTDYGAVGDGVADDTVALQNALNALRTARNSDWSMLYLPPGNYRITATLKTTRQDTNNDYTGCSVIGADPATTTITYDGPAGGNLVEFDGWYCKFSRLTLNGAGKAAIGLQRGGAFSTYCEVSDVRFVDCTVGIQFGNSSDQGQAEHLVQRCEFVRCGTGVVTVNYNSLDIWVWNSLFTDCGTALKNGAGNFHAYRNVFLRSTVADLAADNLFVFSIVGNVSIGSRTFSSGLRSPTLFQGNRIYDTTDRVAIFLYGSTTVFLDNLIKSKAGNAGPVIQHLYDPAPLFVGNRTTVPFAVQPVDSRTAPPPGENLDYRRVIDNNDSTKLNYGGTGEYWQYEYASGTRTVASYSLVNGDDSPGRDPRDFRLQGSNDLRAWTTVDTRTGVTWTARNQKKSFTAGSPAAYRAYRLTFDATAGGGNSFQFAEIELLDAALADTTADGLGLASARGRCRARFVDDTQVNPATVPTPTSVSLPRTPPNLSRTVFSVARNTGDDAQALQNALNSAAASADPRPVVHLRQGAYSIARTVNIPAGVALQIVGDGAFDTGTKLEWAGAGDGPILLLAAPSRATVRDLRLTGGSGIIIDDNDEEGGRIYGEQVVTDGVSSSRGIAVERVERSDIQLVASGTGNCAVGFSIEGGPSRAAGGTDHGRISVLTGTYDAFQNCVELLNGGEITLQALYNEGAKPQLFDLTGRGKLSTAAMVDHALPSVRIPTYTLQNFQGELAMLCNLPGTNGEYPSSWFQITGDGSASNGLIFGSPFDLDDVAAVFRESASPPANIAFLANFGPNTTLPSVLGGVTGAEPDDNALRSRLAQMRAISTDGPTLVSDGLTDVKLFRLFITARTSQTALVIRSTVGRAAATVPAAPAALALQSVAPNRINLTWTDASADENGFAIERRLGSGPFVEVKRLGGGATRWDDFNLSADSNYTYRVRAFNAAGLSAASAAVSTATPPNATTATKINANGPLVGGFVADDEGAGSGFGAYSDIATSNAVNITGVTHAAPAAVYQTARWGEDVQWTFTGLTPGADYTVRLHFAEIEYRDPSENNAWYNNRTFSVAANGVTILSNYNIFRAVGLYQAVVKSAPTTADANGRVRIRFTGLHCINGIEIVPGGQPATPANFTATPASGTTLSLGWNDVAGETGYLLESSTDGSTFFPLATLPAGTTAYTDTGLVTGVSRRYQLTATSATGSSPPAFVTGLIQYSAGTYTVFTTQLPATSGTDGVTYELGMKFRISQAGQVTAVRYYRPASETGAHTGRLWSATGTLLTSVAFTDETASGWQTAFFATPVALAANTTYVVTVNCNTYYASTNGGLSSVIANTPLSSIADGANGLYGTAGQFPTGSYQNTNYFRDILFEAAATTALQQWRQSAFSSAQRADPAISGDLADPDADGIANLLEYAFAGDPLSAASAPLPVASTSDFKLQLTFVRSRADVTYVVQGSSDLATWADLATNPGTVSTATPVVFTDSVTNPARRFLRLKITAP
jgi:hypothetical protein